MSKWYGSFKASESLELVLSEVNDKYLSAKIGKFYSTFAFVINQLDDVYSPFARWTMVNLLFKDARLRLKEKRDETKGKQQLAWNLLNNVICALCRNRLREIDLEKREERQRLKRQDRELLYRADARYVRHQEKQAKKFAPLPR